MPLLNRKPYKVDSALPHGLSNDEEVFVIEYTKEVFRDYEAYVTKTELYRKPLWSCKYSGKGGLTFSQAQEEEQKALASLAKFPVEHEEAVVCSIHHSILPLDSLVGKLHSVLRPAQPAETPVAEEDPKAKQVGPEAGDEQGGAEHADTEEKENAMQQAGQQSEQAAAEKAKKPKPLKAPVSKGVLRTFLLENASQQGPENAKAQVWVVKSELMEKYRLPVEVPEDIQAKLVSSIKAPKKRPSEAATAQPKSGKKGPKGVSQEPGSGQKVKKQRATDASSRPTSASPHAVAVAAGRDATMIVSSTEEGMDDSEPPQPVTAKSLEEVEAQYKTGTVKHVVVQVFKAVRPQGLSVAGIVEKANEMGLAEYDEKQRKTIRHACCYDTNFVRLESGVYSLHCFHPHLVVLHKPPALKKRKISDFSSAAAAEDQQQVVAASRPLSKVEFRAQLASEKDDGEVDSVTKAECVVKHARAAADKHRSALAGAQKTVEAAKKQLAAAKKTIKSPSGKSRDSDIYIPAEQLARFEMTEEEREFKGDSNDRKALLEHRQFLHKRAKELDAEKKNFIQNERAKRDAERAKQKEKLKNSNSEYKAAELALRKREQELAAVRNAAESAEKALADAQRKLSIEKKKAGAAESKAKEKEEREKQKQAEKEEREKRKVEALAAKAEAKKYPMEDLQLLQELTVAASKSGEPAPQADVHPASWMDGEEQGQLSTSLYIADFVHQFGKPLGLKPLPYTELERVLAAASSNKTGGEQDASTLYSVYLRLLQLLLDDLNKSGEIGPMEKRWRAVLVESTWPEVLRRFVLTRTHSQDAHSHASEHVSLAAGMLGFDSADALTHDQHLHLLRFLCDEALDTDKLRGLLQRRVDEADDAKKDIQKEMADERKKLKELQEREKEERKRRKEEDKKKQDEEKAVAAAAEGASHQEGDAPGLAKQGSLQQSGAAAAAGTPAEPSFELPEELVEYTGDPDDKKAILQFRQQQQAERRRLEKAKNKWLADELRRQREIEAKLKGQREAEKAKQKEREAAEAAIARAHEELDEALERYSIRREPLGLDRQYRRYWWGLGAYRPVVFVEDEQGNWGSYSTVAAIESLMDSLEKRGVRESALAHALEKRYQSIAVAMRRSAQQQEKTKEKEPKKEKAPPQPLRRSGRDTQQVEFFNPAAGAPPSSRPSSASAPAGPAGAQLAAGAGLAAFFSQAELRAFEGALQDMATIQKDAAGAGVDPPSDSTWREWQDSLKLAADGKVEGGKTAATATALRSLLQSRLQALEAAVYAVSDKRDEDSSEGEEEEEREHSTGGTGDDDDDEATEVGLSRSQSFEVLEYVDSDAEILSPSKVKDVTWLWRSAKERATWQADLTQALTAARIAYCASVLLQQAEPLLQYVRRSSCKQSGKSANRAVPSSAKVDKKPASAQEPAKHKGNAGGGKRKGASQARADDNMRVTRSRR